MENRLNDMNGVLMQEKPRILVVPMPFQGHIQPIIELSLKIVEEGGYRATVAITKENHERIIAAEPLWLKAEEGSIDLVVLEGIPEETDLLRKVLDAVGKSYQRAVEMAMAAMNPPPCCIISDLRMTFTQDIANTARIPRIAFWTQSAAQFASNLLFAQGHIPPPDDKECITCLPGVPPHTRSDVSALCFNSFSLDPSPNNTSIFKRLVEEYGHPPFRRIHEPCSVVINSFEALEAQALDGLEEKVGFRPIAMGPLANRPSLTASSRTSNGDLDSHNAWLQGHPSNSVLYIAFGTISKISVEQLEELVQGLKASKQPFLWVFRPDFVVDISYKDDLGLVFKNQGMIVPWASQWDILSHPSVGGFLTHAGWNSTLEGIIAGVPLLTWPQFGDQFLTRKCVEAQWGIGFGLYGVNGLVKRDEICDKIRELMHGEQGSCIREKIRSLSHEAKKAFVENGASRRCLQELLSNNLNPFENLSKF